MNTLFKLPGGRAIPLQRAINMGLCDAEGNALTPPMDSQAARLVRQEERKAAWAARQAKAPGRRRPQVVATKVAAPEVTEDGLPKRRRKEPEPLKPQNVTPEGEPITDEETLAEIAAKTAALEAAKAAEDEAPVETEVTPEES